MAKTPAWTRKEGKNPKGGLNAKARASYKGGKAGQWSARKAQMLAKQYKAKGGGYR